MVSQTVVIPTVGFGLESAHVLPEDRIRVQSILYGNPPPKKVKRALLGDLVVFL